ncbi:cation-translocating P-type ATPase, partial [Liquorilactobacillus vini]|uniref:cation-translocating P-type ATPase n=1 Tax=Liquorilactobacillus vini TaxID=238015 RepID=UPI000554B0E3
MNEFSEEQQSLDDNGDDPSAPSQALWQLGDQQLAQKFKTDLQTGLQTTVSDQRLVKDGLNQLQPVKKSWLRRLLKQFNNTISYVLLVTALISLLLQHYPDAIVIGIVIVANALIGYFQEASAADALSKLRSLLVAQTYVIRNGHKTLVPAKNLVRGDLVILEAGDQVPADLRLLSADNLTLQESILTGETLSVTKTEGPLSVAKLPLAERTNLAFAGTSVINGSGVGLVTATGQDTQLGQIQQAVTTAKPKLTPLMQNLNRLGWQLSLAIVLVAVIMFIIGAWMKIYSLPVLLIAVVTMVVGSMPEGMPASVSVVLAMGTRQLAQKHAIVKSLPAVETLGAVDIVNSDKTGTLTKNEMLVTDIMTATDQLQVENSSYGQRAILTDQQNQQVDWETLPAIKRLLQIAGQTTDAVFNLKAGRWQLVGEPTDGALTALYQSVVQKMPIVNEIDSLPFDSALRFSARLATIDQQRILFVKGAPETIFQLISRYQPDFVSQSWQQKMQQLTKQGKRVVALAYQKVAVSEAAIDQLKIGAGLHLVGLVGIIDPPRTEATDSVKKLLYAGVKVKMITGDDPDTAATIAHKLGLAEAIEVI